METRHEIKRLKAIRQKLVFSKQCDCCKNHFRFTRMWHVQRGGALNTVFDWFYCKKCMPTAKDVLHEIDTDAVPFGIAFVDNDRNFKKGTKHSKQSFDFPFIPTIRNSDASYPE